ncbi:MAG: TIGR02147 family protein [Oligoflexia bacterium]|nr:TIGR02147 family protein [Oligoflexia bacterium]
MKEISSLKYNSYLPFLQDVLGKKDRKISLRGLAKLAGISPSHLSRAVSGQKKLSASSVHRLSIALNQNAQETDHLLSLVELENTTDNKIRTKILKRISVGSKSASSTISLDIFRVIADWYYFAVVALINTKSFKPDSYWIGRRLGIKPFEARVALERLIQLGIVQKNGRNYTVMNEADITTTDDLPSGAIKENHSQHLSMAQQAMHEVAIEKREFNNLTIPMNVSDLPKAKEMIREFIDRFDREMKRNPADEVFQMNLQFYQLTKSERHKR